MKQKQMLTNRFLLNPLQMIKQQTWLPYSPRLDVAYAQWSKVSTLLSEGAMGLYTAWLFTLETKPTRRLNSSVLQWDLRENKHFLRENFDRWVGGGISG